MKKLLMTFISLGLLTGCAQGNDKSSDQPNVNQSPVETETEADGTKDNATEVEQETTETEVESTNGMDSLPEFELLSKNIDLTLYTGVVETDNPGNRVILFEDVNGKKTYKSILVKNDNFLKIIKLDDNGLIFKGTVE
jgi:hypothetical protein